MADTKTPAQGIPSPFPPPLKPGPEYGNPADGIQQPDPATVAVTVQEEPQENPEPAPAPQPAPEQGQQAAQDQGAPAPAQASGGQQAPTGQQAQQEPQKPKFSLTQAHVYFPSGQFDKEVQAFQKAGSLMTGYKTLDRIQPLYPGFYCLGAISSLGKTTFCHQMADQIAAAGQVVLYISLEQSHFELYSKSLARGFFKTNRYDTRKNGQPSTYPTPSSMDIRRGLTTGYPQEMAAQIDLYMQTNGGRLCIIDGAFSATVEDIRGLTEGLIKQLGVKPVVIVDYLQIIAPSLVNGRIPDTKTSIDHIVHSLKVLQRDYDLAIIAISSLNRQNYLTPIDFESFKESGGIEYTADVIWGLQLSLLSQKDFYHNYDNTGKQKGETSLKQKREMVMQAKASSPRAIDLVCLKNRYGVSSYTVDFEYFPASDYFCPPYRPNDPDTWD